MIRLAKPSIDAADFDAMREVIESGYLVQGPKVAEFERAATRFTGTEEGIAVSNCTAALHLALLAHGVKPGDRVLVPTYSWPASANVIELCGARPVFVDIDPRTFNIDPARLELTIEEAAKRGEKFAAMIIVHLFGLMADMPRVSATAARHNIPLVEDAACAFGASINGKLAGAWGAAGCFSFHPRKAITTGEGGLISTNDPALSRTCRALRNHGLDPEATGPDFILPGFNYRLTEFQAAFGLAQLAKFERITAARRTLAARYDELLRGSELLTPLVPEGFHHVYQSYITLLPEHLAPHRAELIASLKQMGIETNIGTWHMPLIRYYRERYGFKSGDFPASDSVFARALALPLYEGLTEGEQDQVVAALQNVLR